MTPSHVLNTLAASAVIHHVIYRQACSQTPRSNRLPNTASVFAQCLHSERVASRIDVKVDGPSGPL
jgi:hypothetical protein